MVNLVIKKVIIFALSVSVISACSAIGRPYGKSYQFIRPYKDGKYGVYHTVKPCQTLAKIANAYNVEIEDIQKRNNIDDPDKISPGDKLFIPGVGFKKWMYTCSSSVATKTKRADGPKKEAALKPSEVEDDSIVQSEEEETAREQVETRKKIVKSSGGKIIWPVKGKIIREFGLKNGKMSNGVDISAAEGTPVKAALDGEVIYSGNELSGYGNLVIIEHGKNLITIYAHNKINLVKEGLRVKKGDVIAKVGKTGKTENVKLHFEVRSGKKAVDPRSILRG